jgi:hypothetical protein
MALQITVTYHDRCITYGVTAQADAIYHLRLIPGIQQLANDYVPEKMVIRRKGKIWISDVEDYHELVKALTSEINSYRGSKLNAA